MNFLPFFIANRLYFKNNKDYIFFLISILSKVGIALSIFTLIISISAINGFKILLNKNVLSSLPHGIIKSIYKPFVSWDKMIKNINCLDNINYSEPYILMNSILLKDTKIKFFNIKSFKNIKYIKKYFSFQKIDNQFKKLNNIKNNQIIISSNISEYLSLKKGDWVDLIILDNNFSFKNKRVKIFSFQIKSIFNSNSIINSNIGLVPFSFFQNNFNIKNNINAIELYMSNPLEAKKTILNIAQKINVPIFLYTWINSYKYIYDDINKTKIIIYITLFLLIIISCFSIISISLLSISKKTKDIAILRSIGANNFLIQLIFLYYGMRFIFVSSFIGIITGTLTVLNYKKITFFLEKFFHHSLLLNNIYYQNFLLLKINISDLINIFIITIIIAILTNWYPAYYASKIDPNKILKKF
ncbi:Lipoprotein-releasing system transmembrane protein LolE [Buchnera aphidicola (Protaphis terricola)]|uniref:FtsX-like permease family protein n=1 Tax=Buchnera aphidicola TaxID=9 RepID=UPI0034646B99